MSNPAYVTPSVTTLSSSEIVELMGPAVASASGGTGGGGGQTSPMNLGNPGGGGGNLSPK